MLTDPKCKNASCPATAKRLRLVDSGGLYLEVGLNGSKRWFWKYRIGGIEKRIALGSYPAVSLKAARDARDAAKKLKGEGRDPVLDRQVAKLRAINPEGDIFKAWPPNGTSGNW